MSNRQYCRTGFSNDLISNNCRAFAQFLLYSMLLCPNYPCRFQTRSTAMLLLEMSLHYHTSKNELNEKGTHFTAAVAFALLPYIYVSAGEIETKWLATCWWYPKWASWAIYGPSVGESDFIHCLIYHIVSIMRLLDMSYTAPKQLTKQLIGWWN